jgi:hypothetical protein
MGTTTRVGGLLGGGALTRSATGGGSENRETPWGREVGVVAHEAVDAAAVAAGGRAPPREGFACAHPHAAAADAGHVMVRTAYPMPMKSCMVSYTVAFP